MKGLIVLIAAFIVGCAEYRTLEELELAALESGDWSAVQQRERAIAKRRARIATACPDGRILVCESRGGGKRCSCSSSQDLRDILGSL